MDREIQTTLRVAAAAVRIFDDLGIPLVVVGSVAGIVHQHTRRTHDIDLLADVQPAHVRRLAQALALEWDVQDEVIQEALDKAQRFHSDPDFDRRWRPSFNVGHRATGRRLDVFIPIGDRYERVQLQRRIRADLPSGPLWVVSIEDALLAKAQWAHINGEFSPHQWEDAQALVRLHRSVLNLRYLHTWAEHLGVEDLLDAILRGERPGPPPADDDAEQLRMF
ncbi:hypothetical protein SE17_06600 [Kouleothrix aurantiaca]|jgi:hypothetical protein|uniref:DUF6036 domain-containing protein n=1 Tax=Kouleothrix aurantiaca TaxID=186479 RepID=A0A0N8PSX7_9CHLR|nr:hypothetical protein SE17_06600 [Kouleothrix aurantiaca]